MKYYVEVKNNTLIGKLECNSETVLPNDFIEVSMEQCELIKLPFVISEGVNIEEVLIIQSLLPTQDEIKKAEEIIELLTLIQEVI